MCTYRCSVHKRIWHTWQTIEVKIWASSWDNLLYAICEQQRHSLCICAVWSAPLLFAVSCQNFHDQLIAVAELASLWLSRPVWVFLGLKPQRQVFSCHRLYYLQFDKVWRRWGWSGVAKVSCILHHRGVQLILAYSWARPAILVAGKGRGECFISSVSSPSFLFLFLPCPSLSSPLLSLLSLFFLSLGDDTKWPTKVDVSLDPNTIKVWGDFLRASQGA